MIEIKQEINSYGVAVSEEELHHLSSLIELKTAKKKDIIFRQTEPCNHVIYLIDGITASIYTYKNKEVITRFFQKGNFSTNIVSAVSQRVASDYLIAITNIEYLLIPFDLFLDLYLHSHTIGLFIRKKIIENSIENKKFTTIKTITETNIKYQFLTEHYPQVIRETPAKYIAKFLGLTPEGYSRFLSNKRNS
ncbi:MAG: cyclic nucleotide-binding domain-containing protein [Bacteroidota bacterium]